MSYSDYGGYAYKDGVHIEDRSDYTWTPEGGFGTPGVYPGFAALTAGATREEALALQDMPRGHAVIGDSKFLVTLYKQSSVIVYDISDNQPKELYDISPYEEIYENFHIAQKDIDLGDGYELNIFFIEEDNYYCYARLKQPDGHIWTAFSGYGVGAGLENCGYGFSTEERVEKLFDLFPNE